MAIVLRDWNSKNAQRNLIQSRIFYLLHILYVMLLNFICFFFCSNYRMGIQAVVFLGAEKNSERIHLLKIAPRNFQLNNNKAPDAIKFRFYIKKIKLDSLFLFSAIGKK